MILKQKIEEWKVLLKADSVVTFDTETTVRNHDIGTNKANPFHPDNTIVQFGYKQLGDVGVTVGTYPVHLADDYYIFAGHNIKFDLHHTRKWQDDDGFPPFIWDTQLAQYLLSGQAMKWNTLEQCCSLYGIPVKEGTLWYEGEEVTFKEYWDRGGQTEDIPADLLRDYLIQDVEATETLFLKQIEQVLEDDSLNFFLTQMFALLATTYMEWEGMTFDTEKALDVKARKEVEVKELETALNEALVSVLPQANVLSNKQLGTFLFGGDHKIKVDIPTIDDDGNPVLYKSGKKKGELKTKKGDALIPIEPFLSEPVRALGERNATGWKVGSDKLEKLALAADEDTAYFLRQVVHLRVMAKDLGTYYVGYTKLVWPHDGKIHPSLNHCATGTGRLSSSNPNAQNLSGREL